MSDTGAGESAPAAFLAVLTRAIARVGARIPATHHGVVQLKVDGNPRFMGFICVDGQKTWSAAGLSLSARVWLCCKEEHIKQWMAGGGLPAASCEVIGDRGFLLDVLNAVQGAPAAGNPLATRLRKGPL